MTPPARTDRGGSTLAAMGRAFRHPNYRLFFFGQGTSLIGTWLTRVATSWLVYRLTGSALLLGFVGFAGQIPTFLIAPIAGVLVDRWDRHRVLVVTQVLAMVQSGLLAAFALTGTITVWHILFLAAFQGVINAFDTPARQAFVVQMVDAREDLSNAIALNSSMVNGARLIGPSVAGVLIAAVGEGWCFAIDAISYIAVIASLLAMRIARPERRVQKRGDVLADLREGFRYVSSFGPIRAILLLLALVSLTGMPYTVLMPVFAGEVLHGGAYTLGLLMAASGVGAVTGALWLASRRTVLGLGRALWVAGALFGAGLIGFSLSRSVWLSVPLMMVTGGGMMVQMAASNTLLQTIVDEDKRGRVMSFYTMAFFGMAPFGSLIAGWLGGRIGAPATVLWGGVATLAAVGVFVRKLPELRRLTRPIYVRLGILPEIAEALGRTTEVTSPTKE
ncbi:MFS transporter [Sorangium sp. So ce1151]|uniref:MFS transporter n=1 Tax=Sorangium sp. So ce1151 TaxID=3133332 RepID=UPI003F613214